MNKTRTKFLLVLITAILLFSCNDETYFMGEESPDDNAGIEQLEYARNWYNAQAPKSGSSSRDVLGTGQYLHYTPDYSGAPSWNFYKVSKNDSLTVVDVDLTDRVTSDLVTPEGWNAYQSTHNWKYRHSYTRYVHVVNRKLNTERGFLMTIIPSKYYVQTYGNRIKRNTYLYRDKYLSGYVLFHRLDGKLMNGWKYENGKVVGKVRFHRKGEIVPGSKKLVLGSIPASYQVELNTYTPVKSRSDYEPDGDGNYDGGWLDGPTITPEDPPYHWPELDEDPFPHYPEDTYPPDEDPYDPPRGEEPGYDDYYPGNNNPVEDKKPQEYKPDAKDKLVKDKVPMKMIKQLPNTCVTSIMEYINHLFGGKANEGEYMADYWKTFGDLVINKGVSIDNIDSFTNRHFDTSPFDSFQKSIDKGEVVMTDIPSDQKSSVHNVVVVGYTDDGNLIYMDPEKGALQEGNPSYISGDYKISISGNK